MRNLVADDPQRSYRLLEAIANNASVSLFIMDEHQHCVYMNPAAEKLTGFTLEEVRGRALHDMIHHKRPDGSPYPLHECPIDRAFPENNQEQGEEVFVHKDGSFYPVAYTASPIRESGVIRGTIIEVRGTAAEVKAREELLTFVSLAENSVEFIGMCSLEGVMFYLNPAGQKMVGLPNLEAAIATPVQEFFFPEDRDYVLHTFFPQVLARGHGEIEIRFRHFESGEPIWMIYNVFLLKDSKGQNAGLATVSRNITERKQAEEERAQLLAREQALRIEAERAQQQLTEQKERLETSLEELRGLSAVLAREQAQQNLTTQYLRAANKVSLQLASENNQARMAGLVVSTLRSAFNPDFCGVWLQRERPHTLVLEQFAGLDPATTPMLPATLDTNLHAFKPGWVARVQKPFAGQIATEDPQFDKLWLAEHSLQYAAIYPLVGRSRFHGLLILFSRSELHVTAAEVLFTIASVFAGNLDGAAQT